MPDTRYPTRGLARLGIVVPVSNTNLEPDMMMLAPAGVSLHFTRAGGREHHHVRLEIGIAHRHDNAAASKATRWIFGIDHLNMAPFKFNQMSKVTPKDEGKVEFRTVFISRLPMH